jgi:chloramphenicol 3-O-phosphotransferase
VDVIVRIVHINGKKSLLRASHQYIGAAFQRTAAYPFIEQPDSNLKMGFFLFRVLPRRRK